MWRKRKVLIFLRILLRSNVQSVCTWRLQRSNQEKRKVRKPRGTLRRRQLQRLRASIAKEFDSLRAETGKPSLRPFVSHFSFIPGKWVHFKCWGWFGRSCSDQTKHGRKMKQRCSSRSRGIIRAKQGIRTFAVHWDVVREHYRGLNIS